MADPDTSKLYELYLSPKKEDRVTDDGISLYLYRWKTANPKKRMPVLLLHGASVGHEVFTIPSGQDGDGVPRNLAGWLAKQDFYEPWLLDWRGSKNVVAQATDEQAKEEKRRLFNFDGAAECDIPWALKRIHEARPDAKQIGAVGFCMGAGILAQAIALQHVTRETHKLSHVVLMTLGLFYETPVDSRLKAEEQILEHLVKPDPRQGAVPLFSVDPHVKPSGQALSLETWPHALDALYAAWPGRMKPHSAEELEDPSQKAVLEMCNRLSFMYGMPYVERNLVEEIHGGSDPQLPKQFGAIPIHMFIHGSQNIRRGWAGTYADKPDKSGPPPDLIGEAARQNFVEEGKFEQLTLIGGSLNRLWHRESLDRMYEWLQRGRALDREKYRKVIFLDYGHQDLLWGKNAYKEVFPKIMEGLPPVEKVRRSV